MWEKYLVWITENNNGGQTAIFNLHFLNFNALYKVEKIFEIYVDGHYLLKNDITRKNPNWNAQQEEHNVIIILSAPKRQAFGHAWEGLPWLFKSEWEDTLLHCEWHHSQDWNPEDASWLRINICHVLLPVCACNATHHLIAPWHNGQQHQSVS